MHEDFLPLKGTNSQNLYRIIELRATGLGENSDYILKDWNSSGVNINATLNDVHLTFLVKDTVPLKDAIDKVTKTLEMNLERESPTGSKRSNDETKLAHRIHVPSVPLLNPSKPQITTQADTFPEALVMNEVNNDPYLTYVLFKAFHENYTIAEYKGIDFVGLMPKVKLSYFVPCETRIKFETHFQDISNELIYLVSSVDSYPKDSVIWMQNPCFLKTLRTRKNKCIEVTKNGKVCHQPALRNNLFSMKNPDVMVFTDAFLDELPSYTETSIQNTIQSVTRQTAIESETSCRRLKLRLRSFKNGLKWRN